MLSQSLGDLGSTAPDVALSSASCLVICDGRGQAGQQPLKSPSGGAKISTGDKSSAAVAIQLEALQDIWGDRLVIIYRPALPNLGKGAPDVYRDEVMSEMEELSIPYISLYSSFLQAFREHTPPFGFNNSILGQGHLNQYGHQLTADQVIEYLESLDGLF